MSDLLAKHRLLFGLILLTGAALRFYGLDWGTDAAGVFHRFHPDEETLVNAAANLQFSLEPAITAYGTLPMYFAATLRSSTSS